MRNPRWILPLLATALLAPLPSLADVVEADLLAPGDGLLTRDTEKHLDWLDLALTADLSWNDVQGGAGGWLAAGWRHATTAEVCDLMRKLGEAPDPCPRPDYEDHAGNPFVRHLDLLGRVYTLPGYFTFTEGLFKDGNPADPSVGFLGIYDEFSTGISRISVSVDTILPHRHGGAAGHLLVRVTPQCENGLDDDQDGWVDGADPQCQAYPAGVELAVGCGLGPEPAALLPLLAGASRLRRRARRAAPLRALRA